MANVFASVGASFVAAVHFGVAWVLPITPTAFFAIMVGGILLGSILSLYYLLLAFRSDRTWRGRVAWILAFTFGAPVASFAAWYLLVLCEPVHPHHLAERS